MVNYAETDSVTWMGVKQLGGMDIGGYLCYEHTEAGLIIRADAIVSIEHRAGETTVRFGESDDIVFKHTKRVGVTRKILQPGDLVK